MKRYKRVFKEEKNDLSHLTDVDLVDKIIDFLKQNPYPVDDAFHNFVESIGVNPEVAKPYLYAIACTFICGGNFNKKGKSESDFSEQEKTDGMLVEREHVDYENENPVVKHIAEYMENRVRLDHNSDQSDYYAKGRAGTLQLEELKK